MIVSSHPKRSRTLQYGLMLVYIGFLGFPLLWMLSVSFKGPRELVELHPSLIPDEPTLENYRIALEDSELIQSAVNSLKIAFATALVTTAIALPAAYVLARRRGILTTFGLGWILLSQMFPLILIIIPLFLLLIDLGMANSHLGLVLVYTVWALPFVLWMLQSYVRGIPRDLEEAARVDGASRFQILVGIIAPLLAPGIVVTTLFAFITAWNEYIFASVILTDQANHTTTVWLSYFLGTSRNVDWGALMAASTLTAIPVIAFFLLVQRRIAFGLTSGAVRG